MAKRKNEEVNGQTARRIVIPLGDDNTIDWNSMRSSVKEQYLNLVNNDVTTLEHIGLSHDSGDIKEDGETLPEITLENVRMVIDIVSRTNALAFKMLAPKMISHPIKSKLSGKKVPFVIDPEVAITAFKLTKEQHDELDPRALRVAKKYFPRTATKHLDVWLLVGMFLKFTAENGERAIMAQLQKDLVRMKDEAFRPERPPDVDAQKMNGKEVHPEPESEGGETLTPGVEPEIPTA